MPQIPMVDSSSLLLEVEDLQTHFFTDEGEIRAVDGVSFQLQRGQTLAVVGESGCGKSVMAHSLLRLIHSPGKIVGGAIRLYPQGAESFDILQLKEGSDELYSVRGGRAAMVFQEASAALSPVHTIGDQIIEAIVLHQKITKAGARRLALDALECVGITNPKLCLRQYAHQLSGGMRQRAIIAMALVSEPELLIADEPTTALDVTIQAQILALLKQLQAERNTAILLITHDLSVVAQMADEVLVMYLGRVVEKGSVREILRKPRHPYTIGLLASLPSLTPVGERLPSVEGTVPALTHVPAGCPFHPRCSHAEAGVCDTGSPPRLELLEPASGAAEAAPAFRAVACHRVREVALSQLLSQPAQAGRRSIPAEGQGSILVTQGRIVPSEQGAEEEVESPPESQPVSVAPGPIPSVAPRSTGFMSSVRPRATARDHEAEALSMGRRAFESRAVVLNTRPPLAPQSFTRFPVEKEEREETLPLPSLLAAPLPGSEPPPHTQRREPFGRASQPPPAHTDRPEPFSRASRPPEPLIEKLPKIPGPARLPRSWGAASLPGSIEPRGSQSPEGRSRSSRASEIPRAGAEDKKGRES